MVCQFLASYVPLKEFCTKLCDTRLSPCKKFAHKILSVPSYCSKCRYHDKTQSTFRFTSSGPNVHRNSIFLYRARIPTKRERILTYLLHSLSRILNILFSLYLDEMMNASVLIETCTLHYGYSKLFAIITRCDDFICTQVHFHLGILRRISLIWSQSQLSSVRGPGTWTCDSICMIVSTFWVG